MKLQHIKQFSLGSELLLVILIKSIVLPQDYNTDKMCCSCLINVVVLKTPEHYGIKRVCPFMNQSKFPKPLFDLLESAQNDKLYAWEWGWDFLDLMHLVTEK
ncbi:hypothetical protein ATANTOWER_009512 [Ataeniobius toweri]|uniref:Uncharacterized protein n=1 Tax=Ataeniobius toweri TaxID=208326 RepID=A0ABU7BXW0_9TELE|nr:hypothetical protein [Ataeniobius toweri]